MLNDLSKARQRTLRCSLKGNRMNFGNYVRWLHAGAVCVDRATFAEHSPGGLLKWSMTSQNMPPMGQLGLSRAQMYAAWALRRRRRAAAPGFIPSHQQPNVIQKQNKLPRAEGNSITKLPPKKTPCADCDLVWCQGNNKGGPALAHRQASGTVFRSSPRAVAAAFTLSRLRAWWLCVGLGE